MKRRWLLIFFFYICSGVVCGNSPSDSLKRLIDQEKTKLKKGDLYLQLASFHSYHGFVQSVESANKAKEIAIEEQNEELLGRAFKRLGITFWAHARYDTAEYYFKRALKTIDPSKRTEIAEINGNLGLLHYYQANFSIALNFFEKALSLYRALNDSTNLSRIYNNIGLMFDSQGKFNMANKYLIKGLSHKIKYSSLRDQYYRANQSNPFYKDSMMVDQLLTPLRNQLRGTKNIYSIAGIYSKMGSLYRMNAQYDSSIYAYATASKLFGRLHMPVREMMEWVDIARVYQSQKNYDSAIHYYERSLPLLEEAIMMATLDGILINLSDCYREIGKTEKSIYFLLKNMSLSDSIPHPMTRGKIRLKLASIYIEKKDLENALKYSLQGYEEAVKCNDYSDQVDFMRSLSEIYRKKGQYNRSFEYYERYLAGKDSMQQAKFDRDNLKLQLALNLQLRNNEIEQLRSDQKLNRLEIKLRNQILLTISVVLIAVLFFVIYFRDRYFRVKSLRDELQVKNEILHQKNIQIETLIKEVHHRVKNNLQMISSLLNMQNRRSESIESSEILTTTKARVHSIGLIHEHLYKHDDLSKVSLKEYVDDLVGMLLRTFRNTKKKIKINENIEDLSLDIDAAVSIGLILTELITNSLKYAFKDCEDPELSIHCNQQHKFVVLKVGDNGSGFKGQPEGFGWSVIRSTIENIGGSYEINSNQGFHVIIKINYYLLRA